MKIYGIILFLLFACFLQACQYNSTAGEGGLLSDGYISWTTDGVPFIVHDSITAGDPGENLLYGNYEDSTLSFNANLPYDATSHFANPPRAEFLLAHCRDTGIYVFSTNESDNEHSFAEVYDYPERSDFVTDSSLEGELHLTRFDTVAGRIAGTFTFTAKRFNGVDTVKIGNGVVFDFPITVIKN